MSWLQITKKNMNAVTKIEEENTIVEKEQKEITLTNDEYFYLTKGNKLMDLIFDLKREGPPWLFSKIPTETFYEFLCSFIEFQDIESESIEDTSESDTEEYE